MSLDLYPNLVTDSVAAVARDPGPPPAHSFTEGFERAWDESREFANTDAAQNVRAQVLFEARQKLGLPQPAPSPTLGIPPAAIVDNQEPSADEIVKAAAARAKDPSLPSLAPEDIQAEVLRRMGAARKRDQFFGVRPQSFGASLGHFLGGLAGGATDPLNAVAMAVGAPTGLGILGTAGVEALLNGGAQAANEALTFGTKQAAAPDYSASEAALNVAGAFGAGAVLGGGGKALAKGAAALFARMRGTNAWLPREVADAGNVVTREAATVDAPAAVAPDAAGVARHRSNLEAADAALQEGRQAPDPELFAYRPSGVVTPDGQRAAVNYEVHEASDLVTSHNDDFTVNPAYPPELQPRDRSRAADQNQVFEMASRLDPDRLGPSVDAASGAPIVGPDGIVESGNGRVMAIRRAYDVNPEAAARYRDMLARMGFDLSGMDRPVLVARRTTALGPAERAAFAASANRATAMRLSAAEQAMADSRLITNDMLARAQPGEVTAAANRDFARAFAATLPASERASLFDRGGTLSQEGARRLTAALMARAYDDSPMLARVLEDADSNMRALGGALADVAPRWAAMRGAVVRGEVHAGMDITPDLMDAFRLVQRARDTKTPLSVLADQQGLFEAPSPMTRALLGFMFKGDDLKRPASRAAMGEALEAYASEAMKNQGGARLFGEPLEAGDVLATALKKVERSDLLDLAQAALTPKAVEEARIAPETDAAVLADLAQRTAGEGAPPRTDVPFDSPGGEGVVTRSVDDVLAEADDEANAAAQIRACTAPPAEEAAE